MPNLRLFAGEVGNAWSAPALAPFVTRRQRRATHIQLLPVDGWHQLTEFGDGVGDIWHTGSIGIEGYWSHSSTVGQCATLWSFCVVALPR